MCGLVGLAGKVNAKNKDVFTELLLVDVVRGSHSTGAAAVKRFDSSIVVAKAPIASPYFIGTEEYKKMTDLLSLKCLVGHNRYATVGAKTVANAHPFEFDNLVGAHNGTLDDWSLRGLEDWKYFGTDSEAIYNSIEAKGVKETISTLTGAWALTWFDKLGSTVNLLRNAKRPLFYTYSADRETVYWASEADMLEWVLKRNGVKIFEDSIYECEADRHYKWSIPNKETDKFEKPVVQVIEGAPSRVFTKDYGKSTSGTTGTYKYPASDYTTYGGHSHHAGAGGTTGAASALPPFIAGTPPPKVDTRSIKKVDTKKFRPPYKDAYGHIINKKDFNALIDNGCVYCDDISSKWGDFIHPMRHDMDGRKLYICEDCYNDDDIRLIIENCI